MAAGGGAAAARAPRLRWNALSGRLPAVGAVGSLLLAHSASPKARAHPGCSDQGATHLHNAQQASASSRGAELRAQGAVGTPGRQLAELKRCCLLCEGKKYEEDRGDIH